jgi:hypothetical protein
VLEPISTVGRSADERVALRDLLAQRNTDRLAAAHEEA